MSTSHVSVVTPVYNGEHFLQECIESVLAQTHSHWDYTIVNNCSTDGSLALAHRFAARDARIRVLDNPTFLAQVPNINRAMAQIAPQSRYCKVVLADDWLFPRCLEEMVAVADQHPQVGIVSSYRLDDTRVNGDGLPYPSPVVSGREVCRRSLLEDFFVFGSPTTLLFRSDVVRRRHPFYDESSLHEDTEACYEILAEHDLGFVHQVLSFTRRQNESLAAARKTFDGQHRLDRLIVTMKYGPRFLDSSEMAACRAHAIGAYYRFLGERVLWATDEAFWEYHRAGLASVGLEFDRFALAKGVVGPTLQQLADPVGFLRRLGRLSARMLRHAFESTERS